MSRLHPRLFHQSLVLLAIPLVFELALVALVFGLMHETERVVERELAARAVLAGITTVTESVMECSKQIATQVLMEGKSHTTPVNLGETQAAVAKEMSHLGRLVAADKTSAAALVACESRVKPVFATLNDVSLSSLAHDRALALRRLRELKTAVVDLKSELDVLRREAGAVTEASPGILAGHRQAIKYVLIVAVLFNVALAVGLAFYFHRQTTRRLAIVIDNAYRIVRGLPLNPPLSGNDEIAHMDGVFKEMALGQDVAYRKEMAMIDAMPAGVLLTDGDGMIARANPTLCRMLGFDEQDLLGEHLSSMFVVTEALSPQEFMAQELSLVQNRTVERAARARGDRQVMVELTITALKALEGESYLAILQDVTQRKELERMKQEFVAMVSHDLRTPLTSLQLFLNMLEKGVYGGLSDTGQKKAEMADRSCVRLINLINDLLDMEKLEAGQLKLDCRPITMGGVIDRSIDSVRAAAESQELTIDLSTVPDCPVYADGDRLIQVLVNLLGNAVKFSPARGTVKVSCLAGADWLEVQVGDCGRGVPADLQESIFERFKQVDSKDAIEKKGTGLGLAICKAIIEQHGGTIGVRSNVGQGSTFWFRLPLVREPVTSGGNP